MMAYKQCRRCYQLKLLSEFNKMCKSSDGYQSYCRECSNNYNSNNWQHDNITHCNKYQKQYYANRYANDPLFRAQKIARSALKRIFKYKPSNTMTLLGCDWEQLHAWLGMTLPPGYTLDDIGTNLHLDHQDPPIAAFPDNLLHLANSWWNIQLLPAADNLSKSDQLLY